MSRVDEIALDARPRAPEVARFAGQAVVFASTPMPSISISTRWPGSRV